MTKTASPLRLALEHVLGPVGFSKKGDSWFRRNDETIEVVNLQRSQYGRQYYLNYAVWLLALGEETFPKEERCHVRMRAGAILSAQEALGQLLDLESGVSDIKRKSEFAVLLEQEFLPFLEACRTLNGLRARIEDGKLRKALVHVRAKALLGSQGMAK